jgi:hypothetical protein
MITEGDDDEVHEEWEVLEVVDCRETKRFGVQYKAKYIGNWDEWNSRPPWQPWTDFKKSPDKILKFHQDYPRKPKPPDFFSEHAQETSLE